MGKILGYEEWTKVTATKEKPIYWRKIGKEYKWDQIDFDLAVKWCGANLRGWVYFSVSSSKFIFEEEEDVVMFELWVPHAAFDKTSGHI